MSEIPEEPEYISEAKLSYHQRLQKTRSQLAEAERAELEAAQLAAAEVSSSSGSSECFENESDSG